MALSTYAELSTAIGAWEERTFTTAEIDEFIMLAEANANRKLAFDFRRRSASTVATDSSGVGTVPTGFVGLSSITRDVLGSMPLKQVSWAALIERNPYEIGADADVFAISGTSFQVSPVTEDDYVVVISGSVPALTSSNTTNWLLTLAPDFYLFACQAAGAAKYKAYEEAAMLQSQAAGILDAIVSQGNVAEFGSAEMTLPYHGVV